MKPTQAMLRHVRAYGLTIAPVAARALHLPTADAHGVLEGLVRTGALSSHRSNGALYFTHARRPLDDGDLREAFGVLWFCCMSHPEHAILHPNTLRDRLASAQRESDQRLFGHPRCYLTAEGELSLIRVAHAPPEDAAVDLQRVLGGLQRLVGSRQFRLWRAYAGREPFFLTLLIEDDANVAELSAWLARHPLLALEAGRRGVGSGAKAERVGRPSDGSDTSEREDAGIVISVRVARLERLRRR